MSNYLAIIRHNGIGSWARCADSKAALDGVARIFKSDWSKFLGLKRGQEIEAVLIDVNGYDDVSWGDEYLYSNHDGMRGQIAAERISRVAVKLP